MMIWMTDTISEDFVSDNTNSQDKNVLKHTRGKIEDYYYYEDKACFCRSD